MNYKPLSFLPLIIFILLLTGVGYFMWWSPPVAVSSPTPTEEKTPTTEVAVVTSTTSSTSPTMTLTPTSLPSPTPTPVPRTPIILLTDTPSSTPTATVTPSPTYTPTPTLIPTSIPIGVVTVENLNVRWGPSLEYEYAGALYKGDKVIILGRTPEGSWLQIETPEIRSGWVVAKFIESSKDFNVLPILPLPPTPLPTPLFNPPSEALTLNSGDNSVSGEISLNQGQDYAFFEEKKKTIFVLIFTPNVNLNNTNQVQLFLYYINQIGQSLTIGTGSRPASDRDGNLDTGELIWQGGPLVPGVRYYLRIINSSSQDIKYCLATTDIYYWNCPKN